MKIKYKYIETERPGKIVRISLRALFRAVGMEGVVTSGIVPVEVLDCIRVEADRIGETGTQIIRKSDVGLTRYEVEDDMMTIYIGGLGAGISRLFVIVQYGTNQSSELVVDLKVPQIITEEGDYDDVEDIDLAPVNTLSVGGGGGDYKTDIYMDGDGRVMVERGEDGSTLILDEHENPILKRNADGSTQYFDAYQSARLMIGAHGEVEVAYTEDETTKTLAVAEAILARTKKHLLTNAVGEETIKDEQGNILTHADIYAMLMNTPDFVVLVRADHAFHPNLVTATQIAFTCSYLGANGQISAERVNITSENVVSYTQANGITRGYADRVDLNGKGTFTADANDSVLMGYGCKIGAIRALAHGTSCIANGRGAHSEGNNARALGNESHAEGTDCVTSGGSSHAEGTSCSTSGVSSHAEGTDCVTSGGSSHAEGSYTSANGNASHTEGYRTITNEGGQHAQGCWNKVEGGEYAFMHGCGTGANDRKNAFLISGSAVYILGIGGYDGTNAGVEGVQSLQEYLLSLNH